MNTNKDAWQISEKDFPSNGSDAEKLGFFVRYAILAPSNLNTQPWHFVVEGNQVSIYADRRYGLAVTDPEDRVMTMSCGSALFNLRLAIRYFGYKDEVEIIPDRRIHDLMARVTLKGDGTGASDVDAPLFQVIPKRHINRGAFADKDVPVDVLEKLKTAASAENCWLHVCEPFEREIVVRMVAEADHMQTGNKHFRRELANWLDPRREENGDGLPHLGLSYNDIVKSLTPSFVRRFETENRDAATDIQLDEGSPVLAVLGSSSGTTEERISAGQALMRVLLQAEVEGLSVSFLNQACEVPELRLRLHDELDHLGRAQMILRIGYGGKPSYSPRRNLSSLLTFEGKGASAAANAVVETEKSSSVGLFGKIKRLFVAK